MKATIICFIGIFLHCLLVSGQVEIPNDSADINFKVDSVTHILKYKILSNQDNITIPFEYYRNKLRFKALINGKQCNLMLDNGSLWDELLFFGSPSVDSIGFVSTDEMAIGFTKADISKNVKMEFEDIVFFDQTAVVTRYDPKLPNLWEGTDGQVSATFFKNFIVKINFDECCIELISPDSFIYSGKGQELIMKPGPFNSRLIAADIQLQNGKMIQIDLQIDLGGLYPLYLPLGKYDEIKVPESATELTLGAGLQLHKGFLDQVLQIKLGNYSLYNVKTAFIPVNKDDGVYGNTMIGLPLLQQFNVIFDYFNNRLIIEPAKFSKK